MKYFEKAEDIKYIASQIYERFRDRSYWGKQELKLEKLDHESPFSSCASCDELNYSVSYHNPCITLVTSAITITPRLAEYYEIVILEVSSETALTIRHTPMFRDGIRMTGKLASLNRKINIRQKIENSPLRAGKKNLIIINYNSNIDEIALQIGIYLYREGLADYWAVHELFQIVIRRIERIDDLTGAYDLEAILNKLIEQYRLPNNAKSFKAYIRMLSQDLKRQTSKKDNNAFNIPSSTIYRWIREKKLSVPKSNGKYDWDKVNSEQLITLKRRRELRGTWTNLIRKYVKKRNVSIESAERNLKRWKRKGLSLKDMAERINDVS